MMMIRLASLSQCIGVRHGFFTRRGGVSHGIYASLNCGLGSRDNADAVTENRARAAAALGLPRESLVTLHQIHSARVETVTQPWKPGSSPRADGMATRSPGIMLGSLGADCAAILFADAKAGVIGACHAGWRGANGGVAEATIAAMEGLGADRQRIRAGIGPCIGASSYEVGSEFPDNFDLNSKDKVVFFRSGTREGKLLFDLAGYIAWRLAPLSLASVEACGNDTVGESDSFFSYRRSVLNGEPDYGRNLSAIALDP